MSIDQRPAPYRRLAAAVRRRGGALLAALICAVLVYAIVASFGFTTEARRAPLVVAIPAAVAALALVVKEVRSPTDPEAADPAVADPAVADPATERPAATGVSTAAAMAWVLALTGMFLLFGLLVTVPLFVGIFMRRYGKERWRTVLVTTAVVYGVVYVFFIEALGVQVFEGWLRQWSGL